MPDRFTLPDWRTLFDSELGYVLLLFALFVIPRVLQRWRLPTAITSFALGAIGGLGFGLFQHDDTLHLLATFGIVALFLFAGLEVELHELRRSSRIIAQHLAVRIALLGGVAYGAVRLLALDTRPALLVALALVIPSTGFILDSLPSFGLSRDEAFWVKSKAIATELLALGVLFVVLQSTSALRLGLASLALVTIIAILPPVFRLFAVGVVPWAPKSEFAFLLMMAIVVAYATRQLGVYYLVGAFLVGIAARRFREALPAVASERMLHAVEVFASFFAPFYFFVAGAALRPGDLSVASVLIGVALTVVILPLRMSTVMLQRRLALGESMAASLRVALPMLPTLVFTLVIAGILRERFALPSSLFGALIVYAVLNTTLPGLILRTPPPVYDAPELPDE
ncbi:MAG: cation:proton antiporter [Gemmatimonadaceae bacterium]